MSSPTPVVDRVSAVGALSSVACVEDLLRPEEWAESSLFEVLSLIRDSRSRHGLRHPLRALLAQLVVAFCCGANSVKAAVVWVSPTPRLRRVRPTRACLRS